MDAMILVVDDQPFYLEVLLSILKNQQFLACIADSGEKAVQMLEKLDPDLILLDVMMPGMDGLETCRKIKADRQKAEIPVVFMTALDSVEDKVAGFEAGAVDYITKPFHQAEILARITAHITLRRKSIALEKALNEIKSLKDILPICSYCKKIRDDEGYWKQVEDYISTHTDTRFSHGICPECLKREWEDIDE
nr:response regulator [uncultured Desulfobulbus sp.]